ncbi:MAG: hypothetical protein HYR96_14025 [Deltaproteobacteria bacterium]|nr:hypothetical protein [Deltaproteobacteria bacterium]MBI3295565.1 hypothetical protein [Deltaproteobacteria bacterium]
MAQTADVTVVIPHRDTPDWLLTSVALWQAQNTLPFVLVIDTASTTLPTDLALTKLRQNPGVEVSRLNVGATEHASDSICHAMDYAFSRCPTTYLLATHVDVHPKRRDLVSYLMSLCDEKTPVVGWEMSPRGPGPDGDFTGHTSDGYPGHCCILFHMPTMDRIGAGWSIRRSANVYGSARGRDPLVKGWPDTETCLGNLFMQHGIQPLYLGRETNHATQETKYWTHARSRTILGETPRHRSAIDRARARAARWTGSGIEAKPAFLTTTQRSIESCPYRSSLGGKKFGCGLLRTQLNTDNPNHFEVSRKTCQTCRREPKRPAEGDLTFAIWYEILVKGTAMTKSPTVTDKGHAHTMVRISAQKILKMLPAAASDDLLSKLLPPN